MQKIKKLIDRKFSRHHQYLHDLILHQYTDWSSTEPSTSHGNLRTLVDVITDFQVTSSSVEVVRVHSEFGGRSYLFASELIIIIIIILLYYKQINYYN